MVDEIDARGAERLREPDHGHGRRPSGRTRSVSGTVYRRRQAAHRQHQGHPDGRRVRPVDDLHHQPGQAGLHRHVLVDLLGDAGINIATFHLGREAPGGDAIALIEIDGDLPPDVLAKVRALPQVQAGKAAAVLRRSQVCQRSRGSASDERAGARTWPSPLSFMRLGSEAAVWVATSQDFARAGHRSGDDRAVDAPKLGRNDSRSASRKTGVADLPASDRDHCRASSDRLMCGRVAFHMADFDPDAESRAIERPGYELSRQGRGDHEIWWNPPHRIRVTVDRN